MKNVVFVGIGGFLGAISRYCAELLNLNLQMSGLPINTLVVNLSGCFLLALFLTLILEVIQADESIRLGIATGFLGSYTTFSTFCKEVYLLLSAEQYFSAFSYLLLSAILGLVSVFLGYLCARIILTKFKNSGALKAACLSPDLDSSNGTDK